MNSSSLSLLLGIITVILWGSLATLGNLLIHLPPFYLLGASFLIGGLPALIIRPRELFPDLKTSLWGITGYFCYHFFLFYAFRYAPAIEANLINYMWPVIMVLLTPVFFKSESIKWYHILGVALSVVGCVFLVLGKEMTFQMENMKGYLLAMGAAITWPIYSLGKKKLKPTSVWAIGGFCLVTSLLCFITHSVIEPHVVLQFHDAWKIVLMGLGPFGLAFYTWDMALKNGDAKVIGALAYLTPVLSTLGLIIFVGQSLSFQTTVAMVLIIGGASTGLVDFIPSKVLKKE